MVELAATSAPRAGDLVATGTAALRAAGSPTPRLDAELLVAHALREDRTWLLAHPEAELPPSVMASVERLLTRRASGEPIAYLRGWKEWLSLRILTDGRAMIPRPETELLAEMTMAEIARRVGGGDAPVAVREVGTGSGAVATALALRFHAALDRGSISLAASDISAAALELATANLEAHGVSDVVTIVQADLLASGSDAPDLVVANLPYLASDEVGRGEGSIRHEPAIALDGGSDGLALIGRLMGELATSTAPGATALIEIGAGQADAVAAMAPPGASVMTEVDLAGHERVVRVDLA